MSPLCLEWRFQEGNAPFVHWLNRLVASLQDLNPQGPLRVQPAELPMELVSDWGEWLPVHALWLPILAQDDFQGGGLLLAREGAWDDAELGLLDEWLSIWGSARAARHRRGLAHELRHYFHQWTSDTVIWSYGERFHLTRRSASLLLLLALLLFPIRLTVLAPAELVPLQPSIVRAPLDGVVDKVLVLPNQSVKADDPLFEFDRVSLRSRLEVAQGALAVAQAEYRQKAQRALFDTESKNQLAVLKGQIDEKQIEVDYLKALNERGMVLSPRAGIVLFDDPTQWIGRPVVTGERVMVVADPQSVEIEAWLSPADAVPLEEQSRVRLYLNADPLRSVLGILRYVAHEAVERPDGNYAYRVRARLAENDHYPRVGLKGTAKLESHRVVLIYWVLRRPWAALRTWLGI